MVSTTTCILQLLERGYFSLKSPVCEILPDFPYPQITIQHLLTHTSGFIPDDKAYKNYHGKEEMYEFIKSLPLDYETGTKVEYSDFGFILLGLIVEKLTEPLDQYAKKNIFQPLNMKDTGYNPVNKNRCAPTEITAERGVIQGVCHDGKGYRMNGVSGNAGLFSTAEDLSHFVQMLLNDGSYNGKQILKPDTVHLLQRSYTQNLNLSRTLGWMYNDPAASDGDYASTSCIYHTGFTGTSLYIDFIRQCGIILLTNRVHPTRNNPSIVSIRNCFHNAVLLSYDEANL